MDNNVLVGLLIPLIGTSLGAGCVFFLKNEISSRIQKILLGFAAGVMISASFFSLILPSIEQSEKMGKLAFVPAVIGFLIGMLFLLVLDHTIPHLHLNSDEPEGRPSNISKTLKMMLAVTLHNVPEGMAVGVVYAGYLSGNETITVASALALAIGIAIQNFPEGAIVSMPLLANGKNKLQAFNSGFLSGAVEPISGLITILMVNRIIVVLPYLLSFAAGAMVYVVIEELIPEMYQDGHNDIGLISFAIGFAVMMALDVGLG